MPPIRHSCPARFLTCEQPRRGRERSCPLHGPYRRHRQRQARRPGPPDGSARVTRARRERPRLPEIPARGAAWPARAGTVPPLAEAFTVRADSVPGVEAAAGPRRRGSARSRRGERRGSRRLARGRAGRPSSRPTWPGPCGRRAGSSFLAWVNASSRASVLSGYAEAAARLGLDDGGDAESVAARFAGWLAGTARRWLLVLDDLRDAADLDGLWPGGPAGRVLITAADAAVVPDGQQAVAVPVPPSASARRWRHLFGRLSTDQDQRSGAYDLAEHLGGEPAALAQASAVMADSGTGCRDYQHHFTQQQARLRAAGGGEPPAAAVTWLLSADYAEDNCCPAAVPGRCSCSPRCWTATGFPLPCSPPRLPASTSPTRAPGSRQALSRRGRQRWPWSAPGSSPSARPASRPCGSARRCRQRPAPRHPRNCSAWRCGGSRRATRGMAEGPAPLRPGRPDAGVRGQPAPSRRG